MNNSHWLTPGPQTTITDLVREHATKIKHLSQDVPLKYSEYPEVVLAYKTGLYVKNYIRKHPNYVTLERMRRERSACCFQTTQEEELFTHLSQSDKEFVCCRQRTADDILKYGRYGYCSDKAILFRVLMIAQNIPVSYLETIRTDFRDKSSATHAAARVYGKVKTIIYDPTAMQGFDSETHYLENEKCIIIGEGLDSWDLGIKSRTDAASFVQTHVVRIEKKEEELNRKIMAECVFA